MYIFTYSLKLNYFVLVLKLKKYLWKLMREVFMKKVYQCFVHYEVFVYGDNNPFNATVRQSKVVVSWLSYGLQFSMTPLLKTM